MLVTENASLQNLNTFRARARARFLVEVKDARDINDFIGSVTNFDHPKMVLGGGSNILFTKDYDGCIVRPMIKGIKKISEDRSTIKIRAGAGENWDSLVQYCVENGYGGIENMSWIPGTVGAAPVQNIGAYGMEVGSVIDTVDAIDLESGKRMHYSNRQCKFSYRNSIFKTTLKGRVIITHVTFILHKNPQLAVGYKDLEIELSKYEEVNLKVIRTAIIAIRQRKLPDPELLANAGSFFKNPEVSTKTIESLRDRYSEMPHFESKKGMYKVPAAWLIEQCGWKGRREGNIGTFEKQPLVIVNYGSASGSEILAFSEKVRQAVKEKFGILLETEVNIL